MHCRFYHEFDLLAVNCLPHRVSPCSIYAFRPIQLSLFIDLLERNIDRRLFEIGFLYAHNVDKNSNPLGKILYVLFTRETEGCVLYNYKTTELLN